MGSSAYAKLAWGVAFGDPLNPSEGDYGYNEDDEIADEDDGLDTYAIEGKFPEWFGFTEPSPDSGSRDEWVKLSAQERNEWRETYRVPWEKRRDEAIPVEFEHYGYEFGGTALIVKRTLQSVTWGCVPVTMGPASAPTEHEVAALELVCSKLGFPCKVELLLMALYG
jgi:hypothetical protein